MRRERIGVFRYGDIAEGGGGEGSAEIGVENCGVEIDGAEKGEEVGAVRLAEERGMDRRGRVERREEDLERDLILIGFTCGEFVVFIFFRLIDEVSSRKMNILGANRGYTGKYESVQFYIQVLQLILKSPKITGITLHPTPLYIPPLLKKHKLPA